MAKLSKKALELLNTPATRQDSVDVLNSQLAQNAYYNKLKKHTHIDFHEPYYKGEENLYKNERDIEHELNNARYILGASDNDLKREYKLLNTSPQELRKKAAQYIKYAKSEGKDKYHYLDLVTGAINFDAPFALYNSKIKPKGINIKNFVDSNVPGNSVKTWEYDPLAVTPVDMLTLEQKKLREELYGPQSYSKGNLTNANQSYSKGNVTNTKKPDLEKIDLEKIDLEKIDLEKIPYKQLKELKSDYTNNPELYVTNSNKTKAEYTPEHYIDIVDINGKNPQRIPFESLEDKASYLKQNPLLKLDQYTYADSKRRGDSKPKLKTETLAVLKKKK